MEEEPEGMTRSTLKRTVLESGRHCPMVTVSPSLQRKHGDRWAGVLLCLFSYLQPCSSACCGTAARAQAPPECPPRTAGTCGCSGSSCGAR